MTNYFNGYIEVDSNTNIVIGVYDESDLNTNLLFTRVVFLSKAYFSAETICPFAFTYFKIFSSLTWDYLLSLFNRLMYCFKA